MNQLQHRYLAPFFALLLGCFSWQAQADEGGLMRPYVGISPAAYTFDIGGGLGASTIAGASLRLGVDVGDFFGIEGRIGQTGDANFGGNITVVGVPVYVSGKINATLTSAFAKLQAPLGDRFAIYALAGGTHGSGSVTMTASVVGFEPISFAGSGSSNSFSYGAGGEYRHPSGFTAGIEYMRYFSDVSSIGATLGYRF